MQLCEFINAVVLQPDARRSHTTDLATAVRGSTQSDMYNQARSDTSLSCRIFQALCDGQDQAVLRADMTGLGVGDYK